MKKIYLLWIPVLCLLWRCNENDHMTWKSKGGVYFEDYSQEADSLQYSFRITGLERDTLQLTVKLQGALLDRPMNFRVVTEEGSTAQAGVHYEALKDNYIFPAHQPATVLPVVILKKGEELDHKTVLLKLRLETTTDLDVALPEKCYVRLLVTNQLLKPAYWDVSPLPIYFGAYSQVKHLKCIEIMGHVFPLTQG